MIMMNLKTTLLGLTLVFGLNEFAVANNGRGFESDQKIDRIQVNKMKTLKREFSHELRFGNMRQVKYIKYDVITLAEKDIRFQYKKIKDLQRYINANDHKYYRKGNSTRHSQTNRNRPYYGSNDRGCETGNTSLSEAKRELRQLRVQLDEKEDLLHDLRHNHSRHRNTFNRDLRTLKVLISNMQTDVDLHYNPNPHSQYYRRK